VIPKGVEENILIEKNDEARPKSNSKAEKQPEGVKSKTKTSHQDDTSDSESSSSSSSATSSSSDNNVQQVSKPLFVPKSKRGTIAQQEMEQQKHELAEQQKQQQKQKRTLQSRALVAEAVAEKSNSIITTVGDEDEFEGGGENIPDDSDADTPESQQMERDAWEVRELIRILRDYDAAAEAERQKLETERRRNMTDEERRKEEGYRRPGEARRTIDKTKYLQRYHHRGAFYMDEETLEQAGDDDVRHRAAEYSRAATGEDKIDKSALPEVMQVKKFGFAGYSTKVCFYRFSGLLSVPCFLTIWLFLLFAVQRFG
jgi:microfibrillar-associated protein 1